MSAWLAANLAPAMFVVLALLLFSGVPVVFGLAGCGLAFAWLGVQLDVMPAALINALPLRVFGIMASELLLADAVERKDVALTDPVASLLPATVKVPSRVRAITL